MHHPSNRFSSEKYFEQYFFLLAFKFESTKKEILLRLHRSNTWIAAEKSLLLIASLALLFNPAASNHIIIIIAHYMQTAEYI
jgi:hypothetical protein